MARRRTNKHRKNKNKNKKHTCLRSRRRRRQSGGYGFMEDPEVEQGFLESDPGIGVPVIRYPKNRSD